MGLYDRSLDSNLMNVRYLVSPLAKWYVVWDYEPMCMIIYGFDDFSDNTVTRTHL